ncbi:MAG: alpha/beta hydrolase [Nocardioides sp.]
MSTGAPRAADFDSAGTTCAAWHVPASGAVGSSGTWVVMAHGFSLTRHDGLLDYAHVFAEAGADVLVFDHRFLGDSGGTPRQRVRLKEQRADWAAAVAHARSLGAERVVLWGFSMSGAHVVQTAIADPTIDGVLAMAPFINGFRRVLAAPMRANMRIVARAIPAALGSKVTIPVTAQPGSLGAMALTGEADGFAAVVPAGSPWRNEVSPALFVSVPVHRPYRRTKRLTCPAWFGLGERDITVHAPSIVAAADRAPRGELVRYPEHDHWTPFVGDAGTRIAEDQLAFLHQSGLLPSRRV